MNVTYERTTDWNLIKEIVTHPRLYTWATDDFSPPASEFEPNNDPRIWYLIVWSDSDHRLGLLTFLGQSTVLWEVHCCLLPSCWGRSAEALTGAFDWIFGNTSAQRIVATIPIYNRLALKLAEAADMKLYGANPKSFMKNGELHDTLLFGISKE